MRIGRFETRSTGIEIVVAPPEEWIDAREYLILKPLRAHDAVRRDAVVAAWRGQNSYSDPLKRPVAI